MGNRARKSVVWELSVISIDNSSAVEIGDCDWVAPTSNVLSVQRELAMFRLNEFRLRDYGLFNRPVVHPAVTEHVFMNRIQAYPVIRVGRIRVTALSSSCVIQIGSSRRLHAESRMKHIRHLFRDEPVPATKER